MCAVRYLFMFGLYVLFSSFVRYVFRYAFSCMLFICIYFVRSLVMYVVRSLFL